MSRVLLILSISIRSLTNHKLRSVLTMLGIVIGVAAVISLVAVGQGAQAQVVKQFQSLGSNLLTITARNNQGFSRNGLRQTARTLRDSDVDAIRGLATTVSLIAPEYNSNATVVYGGKTSQVSVSGVTQEYAEVRNWTLAGGGFITAQDNDSLATVVVLGERVVSDLFGSVSLAPIGQNIRINRQNYEIIGIMKAKGENGATNQDNIIFMPLRTAQVRLGGAGTTTIRTISLQVRSTADMELATAQVTAILHTLHGIRTGAQDDFMVQNQADIVSSVTQSTGTFTALLGSIAAISLLVGGIGIMNIMLVSVIERTREVGLRKAVGAKRSDILVQFLVEAMTLSVLGGLIGVALGVGGAKVLTPLLGGAKTLVTWQSIALSLSVSLAIGIFFGLYPANRAAKLSPIDALRAE